MAKLEGNLFLECSNTLEIKKFIEGEDNEKIVEVFDYFLQRINLSTATKLFLVIHLVLKIATKEQKEFLKEKWFLKKLNYFPNPRESKGEALYCDFLSLYATYLDSYLHMDDLFPLIFNESVDFQYYTKVCIPE